MTWTIVLYATLSLFSVLFLYFGVKEKERTTKKNRNILTKSALFIMVSFMSLLLLAILRDTSVGTDYQSYISVFQRITNDVHTSEDIAWLGSGFVVVLKILSVLTFGNYWVSFALISFFTLWFFYKGFLENSKKPWLSLFLFVSTCLYFQLFNQFRQMLAVSIIFYSVKFIKERSLRKYILFSLLAFIVHPSSIVMFPMYWLCQFKVNTKRLLLYGVIALTFFQMTSIVYQIISHTMYSGYIGSWYDNTQLASSVQNFLVRLCLLIWAFIFKNPILADNPRNKVLFNMAFACTIIQLLSINISLLGRITTYFFVFYLLLIPEIVSAMQRKYTPASFANFVVIALFTTYFFVYFNSSTAISGGYREYSTIIHPSFLISSDRDNTLKELAQIQRSYK